MIQNDYEFLCPYCGSRVSIRLDATGGRKQQFVYDCEVCCRPIHIQCELDGSEVISISTEQEN